MQAGGKQVAQTGRRPIDAKGGLSVPLLPVGQPGDPAGFGRNAGILAGLAFGYAVGELVSLGTNRRSGPPLQTAAVGGVVLAYVVRTALLLSVGDWGFIDVRVDLVGLIVVTFAGFIAAGRLR